jgi:hypothetical protein
MKAAFLLALVCLAIGSSVIGTSSASARASSRNVTVSRCLAHALRRYPSAVTDAKLKKRTTFYEACMKASGYRP